MAFFFSCPEHQGVFWCGVRGSRGEAGCDCRFGLCWERGLLCATHAGHSHSQPLPISTDCRACTWPRTRPTLDIWDVTTSSLQRGCLPCWATHHCGLRADMNRNPHPKGSASSLLLCAAGGPDCKILPLPDSGRREKT